MFLRKVDGSGDCEFLLVLPYDPALIVEHIASHCQQVVGIVNDPLHDSRVHHTTST